ncbi:MAG: hypothetical protein F6K00_14765 [Leptolyngbya sp. SIOISBB]|nr:hypothetical protein [Leptolyngbya sp. SIOISBB]
MPAEKYIVSLTFGERNELEQLVNTGKAPAYKINHARLLFIADTQQRSGGFNDATITKPSTSVWRPLNACVNALSNKV